jgi:hypothetical protein
MTQETTPLGPPPRKAHTRRAIRNLRRGYYSLFLLLILVFGGWALMDIFRWEHLAYNERVLTVGFALLAVLAAFVLQMVNHPLRRELRLARRGIVTQAEIVRVGWTRRRRPAPLITYKFYTVTGATFQSECILPRRFPASTLSAGMTIEVLYDPRRPRLNKPRLAMQLVEFAAHEPHTK